MKYEEKNCPTESSGVRWEKQKTFNGPFIAIQELDEVGVLQEPHARSKSIGDLLGLEIRRRVDNPLRDGPQAVGAASR